MLFFKKKKEQTLENKREKELEVLLNEYRHLVNECLATMETDLECQSIDIGQAIKLIGEYDDLAISDLERCRKNMWLHDEIDQLETKTRKIFKKYIDLDVPVVIDN